MTPAFRLHLLGPPQLTTAAGEVVPMPHRHRLALLTLLAVSPGLVLRRDKAIALLWPEQDTTGARNLLNVAVHGLRRVLGQNAIRSVADELSLNTAYLAADVWDFRDAVASSQAARAAELYRAPFIDGFHLARAAELAHWIDTARAGLAEQFCKLLDRAADESTARGDHGQAVAWLRRRSHEDPYNTRAVTRLVLAMEQAGQVGGAVQVARAHEALLQRDFEVSSDPSFVALIDRLRSAPSGHHPLPEGTVLAPKGPAPDVPQPAVVPPLRRWLGVTAAFIILGAATARIAWRPPPTAGVWLLPVVGDSASRAHLSATTEAIMRSVHLAMPGLPVRLATADADSRFVRLRRWLQRDTTRTATVTASLRTTGDSIVLDGRLVDRASGALWRAVRVAMPRGSDSLGVPGVLAERMGGAIALTFDPGLEPLATAVPQPPALASLGLFRRALDEFVRADYQNSAATFREAWHADSALDMARTWEMFAHYHGAEFGRAAEVAASLGNRPLAEGDRFGVEWLRTRLRGDVPGALRAAREAARRMPRSQWAFAYAEEALALRRPHEVIAVLTGPAGTAGWIGGWSGVTRVLAGAYHLVGDFDAEARVVDAGARAGTDLHAAAIHRLPHLAARGDVAELERIVNTALATPDQFTMSPGSIMQRAGNELEAHGFAQAALTFHQRAVDWYAALARSTSTGLWPLGRMLRAVGQTDSARRVMQRFVALRPGHHIFADLGLLAAEAGDRAAAWHYDSLLGRPEPGLNVFDASARVLQRSAIRAALGEREPALEFLQRAISMGVPVALDSVHVPRAFRGLRGWAPFDHLTHVVPADSAHTGGGN